MNYDAELSRIIEHAKRDPTLHAKWRNKGIGKLDEAQALFAMGKRMTNLAPPEGTWPAPPEELTQAHYDGCTCIKYDGKIAGTKADCPEHGHLV